MKRQLPSIEWSLCCICEEGGDLRSTNDGIKTLSSNLLKHWEDEVLDFHTERIANKNGKPDCEGSMLGNNAKYHHDCTRKYTDYKRERKQKSLEKKRKKSNPLPSDNTAGPSLRNCDPQQVDSFKTNKVCTICGKGDKIQNLCAAGAFHATKSKLNTNHVAQLTEKWRKMAFRVGDDDLLSRLMVGDLGTNSTFYHKECYSNLYNIYTKVCKESEKAGIDIEQYKDAAYDKVIAYI